MSSKKTLYAVQDDSGKRELPPLTWQLLSHSTAAMLLLGSFALWLRLLLTFVDLAWPATIGQGAIVLTTLLIVLVLAIGCAFVPPILWSAIIPSTVASNVLSWLYAKYGTVGYYFCLVGALIFTAADLWLVSLFWQSQMVFHGDTEVARLAFTSPRDQQITLVAFTALTVFLFVGFTSWALNRMTPAQLLAAISEGQNAATIMRAEKLKDMQFQITYAYGVSLLKADLLSMGTKAFGEKSSQFAAIVADMEQHEATAFRNMAELMEAMGIGENVFDLVYAQNDDTRQHYRRMIKAMRDAADYHRELADYSQEMAEVAAPSLSSALPAPSPDNVIEGVATVQSRTRERMHVTPSLQPSILGETTRELPAQQVGAHVNTRSQSFISRDGESGSAGQDPAVPDSDHVIRRAREDAEAIELWRRIEHGLPEVITAQNVADLMQWKDKQTGQRLIRRWVDIGIVEDIPKRPGRYSRTGKEF